LKIKDQKDFNAGLMFIIIGGIFAIVANSYPMGSAVRMGPAYFPTILGWLTVILGVIVLVGSFVKEGEAPRKTQWRGLLWIIGSVVMFGLLTGPFNGGLIPATVACVIMSSYGGWEHRWKEAIIGAIVLAVSTVVIFYYGLGLPFRLWPWS